MPVAHGMSCSTCQLQAMQATLLHHILDRRARTSPEAKAVTCDDESWTYGELHAASLGYAGWLADLGVQRGDRVLVIAPHALQTVAVVFAASRLGALYVVVADELRPYVLGHILRDCEPRTVLVAGDATQTRSVAGSVPVHRLDELPLTERCPLPREIGISLDPVGLTYTSGSTAMPKAVVSTHLQVLFAANAIAQQLDYRDDDVVFCCLPLSFDYGLYQIFLSCLRCAELVLGRQADAGPALLGALREHGATVLPAVPSLATILAALVARSGRPPTALRLLTNTGAALSDGLIDELATRIPGLEVAPMFGLTECKRVSIMAPSERARRPGSVGRPLPDTEVFVVDDDGRRLGPGCVGELVVRGPNVMAGYWRAPELTAARFRRDKHGAALLFTGDQCRLDADGYLYFVSRRDELFKQGGVRMSALEVEAAAMDIAGVQLAALLLPTAERGALLAVSGNVTREEVLDGLALRLEEVRLPRACHVLENLPLQPSGKVDKRALADVLAQPVAGRAAS